MNGLDINQKPLCETGFFVNHQTIKNHYRLCLDVTTPQAMQNRFADALICCLYFHALVRIWITSRLVKVTAIYMSNPLTQRNH
jgi:hypothetical protein